MSDTLNIALPGRIAYAPPGAGLVPERRLIVAHGPDEGRACVFYQDLQIGRMDPGVPPSPGTIYLQDPTVSSKHCVITQDGWGRCFVRDTSRNGTWVEGRRIVPGTEVEIRVGERLTVGQGIVFRLEGNDIATQDGGSPATFPVSAPTEVTVLIGDIRGYTTLVTEMDPERLQRSVSTLFQRLEQVVIEHRGTVKEYPGDALLAYWEKGSSEHCAVRACRAALALDTASRRLARDPVVWSASAHALQLDWALATGTVMIQALGGEHPVGLSMVGEPVIKAYRLEKLADDASGPVLACRETCSRASAFFRFVDLGEKRLDGFPSPERVYSLVGPR